MQGLRNLRRRMPLRRHRDGAGDDLRRPRPALLDHVDLFSGLGIGGYLLINTRRKYSDLGLGDYVTRCEPGAHQPAGNATRPASHVFGDSDSARDIAPISATAPRA